MFLIVCLFRYQLLDSVHQLKVLGLKFGYDSILLWFFCLEKSLKQYCASFSFCLALLENTSEEMS